MKREFKNRLVVKGQMPVRAHMDIPADTPVKVYSTHITTIRGLKAALRQMCYLMNDYSETHGNRAAAEAWIELNGERLNKSALELMVDFSGKRQPVNHPAFLAEYESNCRIIREVYERERRAQEE